MVLSKRKRRTILKVDESEPKSKRKKGAPLSPELKLAMLDDLVGNCLTQKEIANKFHVS